MAVVGTGELDHPISTHRKGRNRRACPSLRSDDGESATIPVAAASPQHRAGQGRPTGATQAQLVQSEKLASIGEMSAAVAHGLRNPLASLRAAAQMVRRHPESPSSAEYLDAILSEVDRLDRRISHLLSFSRPAPFHPLKESVPSLIEGLLPAFSELVRERGVKVSLDVPPMLPEVRVDPMQIEQALLEISRTRSMPCRRAESFGSLPRSNPGMVTIKIADTGAGIPEQVLPSVWEPFFTTRPRGYRPGTRHCQTLRRAEWRLARHIEPAGIYCRLGSSPAGDPVRGRRSPHEWIDRAYRR